MRDVLPTSISPRILINPDVRFGQPVIHGTRITVWDIMSYFGSGMTEEEILSDFPSLTREDLRAAHEYVAQLGQQELSH
jgi:uncharacterized protein (DUF433 family)